MFVAGLFQDCCQDYLKRLRAYPTTVPTTQYPDCSMCPCFRTVIFYGMFAQDLVAFVEGMSLFYGMFAQDLVAFCRGKLCHFLARIVVNDFFFCRMDLQILAKSARGYPHEGPERSKTAEGHPRTLEETTKKRLQERLGALLRRFGRVLSVAGASRGGPGHSK